MARPRKNQPPAITAPLDALPPFEGVPVIYSSVAIAKAGDGLSDALKVDPIALHHGEEVWFVLRGHVAQVNHVPIKSDDSSRLVRKHRIDAEAIAIINSEDGKPLLDEALAEVKRKIDESRGVQSFDYDGTDPLDPAVTNAGSVDEWAKADVVAQAVREHIEGLGVEFDDDAMAIVIAQADGDPDAAIAQVNAILAGPEDDDDEA